MDMLGSVVLLATEAGGEEPNPILPEMNEVIWGTLAFFILLFILQKVAFPAIKASIQAREDKIRGDLESAESEKVEAEHLKEEYQRQLADARNQAGRIIEEARQAAEEVRRDLIARAETEAGEIKARAQVDIDATLAQAKADLQRQVAEFAITLAEKVVERSIDRQSQQQLIESYIAQVGGMSGSRN